jgi:hypothetical protein
LAQQAGGRNRLRAAGTTKARRINQPCDLMPCEVGMPPVVDTLDTDAQQSGHCAQRLIAGDEIDSPQALVGAFVLHFPQGGPQPASVNPREPKISRIRCWSHTTSINSKSFFSKDFWLPT